MIHGGFWKERWHVNNAAHTTIAPSLARLPLWRDEPLPVEDLDDLDPEDEIKQQQQQQQARADGRRQAPSGKPDLTKKGSSLTRILSFNRKNSGGGAPSGAAPSANGSSEAASSSSSGKKSVAGSMIRKLSFSKKKESSK